MNDLQGRDPYQVLGVPPDATPEDLRQAYRRLARRYHPDKNPQGQAAFAEIASAYGLLSDPGRRLRYDAARTVPSSGGPEDDSGPGDDTGDDSGPAAADGAGHRSGAEYGGAAGHPGGAGPPGREGGGPRGAAGSRAGTAGARPESPAARLERLYGPRPTVRTAAKLVLFHLPAGGFLSVLVSAFITFPYGDAARDLGRIAAVLLWLALWSFLAAAKLKLWLLYRRTTGTGRS
ncbi:J domain-containing protein [Planomonospora sp. ID67723]|uniref:J domain-containing protein n=1 Tax=Planomonospora sp. ID67723 TaxID=2738134 RepID=UPI0018C380FC|nr:J domain-containing protein [Planomonospora sp. ID67723]MBG0827522.1 J domain-containing protein [Planomonospora sp. ID67723]